MVRSVRGAGRSVAAAILLAGVSPLAAQAAQTTQYTYDALGRVVSAIDADGKKVAYTYDSAGNRTRVSNGAEFTEITPSSFSASSNAGTTGLTATNGMRDGALEALASIHATNTETNAWIMADLGSAQTVNHIDVAPALASSVGASIADLNDTVVEYSVDGTKWALAATINSVAPGASRTIAVGGVSLRYLRIRRALSGQVAIGDLRLYSAAVANSPLIAQPDSIASSGSAVTFDPRTNDQDLDGYSFSISAVEDPPHGTAVINSGTSLTYTPDAGYLGADTFLYTVADGHNGTASARVTVLVRPSTNHAPVAIDDPITVSDRVSGSVAGIATLRPADNDYDADGDVLTITAKTTPSHGTATLVGSNIIEYQPTASYSGSDTFDYTISDGRGGADTGTITLTVGNSAPQAGPDSITVPRSGTVTFDPKLNDRDPNGDAITVGSVTAPGKGVATLNGDQSITYVANTGAVGGDNFTYALSDGRGGSATGSVTVSIAPNSSPVARGDSLTASGAAVTFDPRINDTDAENDPLTVVEVAQPAHGSVQITTGGGSVTYTPTGGYTGFDEFSYTVSDDEGASATAKVAVNGIVAEYLVVGGGGGGQGSVGGGGGGGGVRQGAAPLNLSSVSTVTVGTGGTSGGNGGGSTFGSITAAGGGGGGGGNGGSGGGGSPSGSPGSGTSGQGYAGGASLGPTYQASGGGGGAGGPGTAAVNTSGGQVGGSGGKGIISEISGAAIDYAAGGPAGAGESEYFEWGVTGGQPGGASSTGYFVPANRGGGGSGGSYDDETGGKPGRPGGAGIVVLRYTGAPKATGGAITQAGGFTIHTFTAGGSLTVTAANAPPSASGDSIYMLPDRTLVFDPRTNDTDPNGDALSVLAVTQPGSGSTSITHSGTRITYQPGTGFTGTDSFSYTLSDGQGGTSTATVTATVQLSGTMEFLVVGGGGSGGNNGNGGGGGGGGGGVIYSMAQRTTGTYTVTVGGGGTGASGGTSSFGTLASAIGGGYGAVGNGSPGSGGSGGGSGGATTSPGGSGQMAQGSNGGASSYAVGRGGGGGGATAPGASGLASGNGGEGYASTISGSSAVYGSGGGAGGNPSGSGGTNAGAGGGSNSGVANRGGGGGGGSYYTGATGGSGGSGIVIVRYYGSPAATGGTVTQAGGYTIHTFTSSGTFTVP